MRRVGARECRPLGRVTGNPSEEEESLPPSSLRGNVGKSAAVEVDALLVEKLDGKLLNHSTRLASLVSAPCN